MLRIVKWSLPMLAFGVMVALSGVRAGGAEDDAAKKTEKVKVSGVVLLEDGSPAASARVRLVAAGASKKAADAEKTDKTTDKPAAQAADGEKPAEAEKPKPTRPEAVAETTTDAAGKFSLEAPAGKYRVAANLKGAGSASKTITVKSGEPMENVELKLKPTAKRAPAAPAAPAQ